MFQAQPPRMSIVMELAFLCYLHSLKLITDFLIFNYCSIVTEATLFDCILCKFKRFTVFIFLALLLSTVLDECITDFTCLLQVEGEMGAR